MKKVLYSFFVFGILAVTSCNVTKAKYSTAKSIDIYHTGIIQKPVVVDLDVKETKVSGIATENSESASIETVKQEAIVDAVKKANADILVEPMFTTETIGEKITVTVSGFPANYKNFRSIKHEDLELLNTGNLQKVKVYEPKSSSIVSSKKNKTTLKIILGFLIIAIVGIGIIKGF
jgi:hypothetical protein